MRLTLLVTALLSSTLAIPLEDAANEANKQIQGQVKPQAKQAANAHYAHKQVIKNPHYGHTQVAGAQNAAIQGAHHVHAQYRPVQAQRTTQKNAVQRRPAAAAHQVAQAHQQAAAHHNTNWGSPGYSNNAYQTRVLKHHNYHRDNHLAVRLQWDPSLAHTAQLVAQTCIYAHNLQYDPGAGQNIAAGYGPDQIGIIITDLFYNNELPVFNNQWYREPDMSNFERWGHMTQMCWKDTTHLGCATAHCPFGLANVAGGVQPYFTVCNYKNPGNVATEYARNLSPPQGAPSINGNSF